MNQPTDANLGAASSFPPAGGGGHDTHMPLYPPPPRELMDDPDADDPPPVKSPPAFLQQIRPIHSQSESSFPLPPAPLPMPPYAGASPLTAAGSTEPGAIETSPEENPMAGWVEFDETPAGSGPDGYGAAETEVAVQETPFESTIIQTLRLNRIREQYADCWRTIQQSGEMRPPRVVALTECCNESHSAHVLGHVAVWLARDVGKHVLLVDADLERRELTRQFCLNHARGLADVCMLRCDWPETVVPTSHPSLSVLPLGNGPIDVARWDAFQIANLVKQWKELFDTILIDAGDPRSPLFRTVYPTCDATYLLVRLGLTPRDAVDETIDYLEDRDMEIAGCLVTNLP